MSFFEVIELYRTNDLQNVFIYKYIYMIIHMHTWQYIYIYICIHVYIYTYIYIFVRIEYTHIILYLYLSSLHFKQHFPTSHEGAIPYFQTNEHGHKRVAFLSPCSVIELANPNSPIKMWRLSSWTWLSGQVCLFLLSLHGSFHRCYSSFTRWCVPRGSRKRPVGWHPWWIPGTLRMTTLRTILHGWIWGVNTLYSTWFKAKLAFIYKAWDFIAFR